MTNQANFSVEFFPPNDLGQRHQEFKDLWQSFCALGVGGYSITFGALGHSQAKSHDMLQALDAPEQGCMHLTCRDLSWSQLDAILERWRVAKVKSVLALRGDHFLRRDDGPNSSVELVAHIARHFPNFEIGVAGYPDPHPDHKLAAYQATTSDDWLRQKLDAGATKIVTQFSFSARQVLRLRDSVERSHPTVQFAAGVLPVSNPQRSFTMAKKCGVPVPRLLEASFRQTPKENRLGVGMHQSVHLIHDLIAEGLTNIHLYALNRFSPCNYLIETFNDLASHDGDTDNDNDNNNNNNNDNDYDKDDGNGKNATTALPRVLGVTPPSKPRNHHHLRSVW